MVAAKKMKLMKYRIIISFTTLFFLLQKNNAAQTSNNQAFLHISEEKQYPYDIETKNAKKIYTWFFNSQPIKYKTAIYNIKVNTPYQLDTICLQQIFKRTDILNKKRRTVYDTSKVIILCKFRANHNYKLGQIFPGHFEIYSLDTLETEKHISLKLTHNKNRDTLYMLSGVIQQKIYSDSIINFSKSNDKLKDSFIEDISLNKTKREFFRDESTPIENTLFRINFNFLHAEKLEIEYNCETGKYRVKLLN